VVTRPAAGFPAAGLLVARPDRAPSPRGCKLAERRHAVGFGITGHHGWHVRTPMEDGWRSGERGWRWRKRRTVRLAAGGPGRPATTQVLPRWRGATRASGIARPRSIGSRRRSPTAIT